MKIVKVKKILLHIPALILLLLYYLTLPVNTENNYDSVFIFRFALYAISLHLLVSFIAFLKNEINGFWEFNRTIFQRILTALVYSGVLYAGLSSVNL